MQGGTGRLAIGLQEHRASGRPLFGIARAAGWGAPGPDLHKVP